MPKPRINIAAINAVLRNRRSSDDKSRKAALSGQDGASGGLPSARPEERASGASEINVFDGIDEAELLAADSWLPYQANVRWFYSLKAVQWVVALLIMSNFLINIIEKEVDPLGRHNEVEGTFDNIYMFFNIVFLLELLINMYAHGLRFWISGWNLFDLVVVTIGVISMFHIKALQSIVVLRTVRAFRVFRLFKRVESLHKIIVALGHALPGVANALVVLLLVMCIYAIVGVEVSRATALPPAAALRGRV